MRISSKELQEKIKNGEKLLIDCYSDWCGPCKVMKPLFEKIAEEMKDSDGVKLYLFNVEDDKDFAINILGIRSIPTIKGFNNGEEVYTKTGILRKDEIIDLINQL